MHATLLAIALLFSISSAERARVVHAAAEQLRNGYVFVETGNAMAADIEARLKRGEYDRIDTAQALADRLTANLRAISHDQHLRITYSDEPPRPAATQTDTSARRARITKLGGEVNYGFPKAEVLPGNIGYLEVDGFWHLEYGGGETAAAAMTFLGSTDALIFDLRNSTMGGDPEMSILLKSYLFATPTHLSDFYSRATNETRQWWTQASVPGPRYVDKPVYVLTSTRTFSAGEGFAYDLQAFRRAMIIGETTAGAAHPEDEHALGDGFTIELPFARGINTITKTDWEGVGVKPDIATSAAAALDTAQLEALTILAKQEGVSARLQDERQRALAAVRQRLAR